MENNGYENGMRVTYDYEAIGRKNLAPHKLYLPTPERQARQARQEHHKKTNTKKRSRNNINNNNNLYSSPKRTRMTETNIIKIEKKISNINKRLLDCKKEEFHKKYEDDLKQVEEDFTKTMDEFITDLSHSYSESTIKTIKKNINNNYNKEIDKIEEKYKKECKKFKDTLYNKRQIEVNLLEHYYNSIKHSNKKNNTGRRVLPLGMPPRLDLGVDQAAAARAPARAPAADSQNSQYSQNSQNYSLNQAELFRMQN
jgi:hypothetical protein